MKATGSAKRRVTAKPRQTKTIEGSLDERVQSALAWLKRHATKATRDGMAR